MLLLKIPNVFAFSKPEVCLVSVNVAQGRGDGTDFRELSDTIEPVEHHFCPKQSLKELGLAESRGSLQVLLVFGDGGVE